MVDTPSNGFEPPHPNGSLTNGHTNARASLLRRRLLLISLSALVVVWIFAIVYSVLYTTHSPERLDRTDAAAVAQACTDAQGNLRRLPNSSPITGADRVARIRAENEALRAMAVHFDAVEPKATAPREALRKWTADWRSVIDAREKYAHDLETVGRARFVLPATGGIKPITDRMDDFVRENHPRIDACITSKVQLEQVEGPRVYGKDTTG